MSSSNVRWDIRNSLGVLTFHRPEARNALTWDMYAALVEACDAVDARDDIRVLIIRGSGGSFAAGTDISQFETFTSGADGVAYEHRLDAIISRLERVTVPTIAEVDGAAVGGGALLALACDLRVCSPRARFGVPVSRTLGNCLSMVNTVRLMHLLGEARVRDLMLTGRLMDVDEARQLGLVSREVPSSSIEEATLALGAELCTRARSTITATRTLLQRLREARLASVRASDDLVEACYGSDDFREGVRAFLEGRPPRFS
jgi:enoyl-CoA hydratase/carnithine racemase